MDIGEIFLVTTSVILVLFVIVWYIYDQHVRNLPSTQERVEITEKKIDITKFKDSKDWTNFYIKFKSLETNEYTWFEVRETQYEKIMTGQIGELTRKKHIFIAFVAEE